MCMSTTVQTHCSVRSWTTCLTLAFAALASTTALHKVEYTITFYIHF